MISYKISNEIRKKLKEDDEQEDLKTSNKNQENDTTSSIKEDKITYSTTNQEKENKTNLKDKTLNEVIDDLNDIKTTFGSIDYVDAPEKLGLEKIDVKEYTDDELNKIAQDSLAQKYKLKTQSTNDSFLTKIDDILKETADLKSKNQYSVDKINNYYDNSRKETENQALKRGLARSSIIISEISNLESGRAKELSNVLETLQNSIFENEVKIQNLSRQKEEALNNLDIEYAIELDEKINKLTEDFNKQKEDAIKFNNNVEKLEAEYKLNLDKQKLDKTKQNLALKDKYGDIYKTEIQEKQYSYLKNYFDSLEPKYALSLFLSNKELKNILGDNYAKMYKYLSSKF